MKAFFDERQCLHDPQTFMLNGKPGASPEQPERVNRLLSGVNKAGCVLSPVQDHGMAPLARVHSVDYLDFLQTIHAAWQTLPDPSPEVVPKIHPRSRRDTRPASPIGLTGWHQMDTSCPIGEHTWSSAYWSAQTAVCAAEAMLAGEPRAYALCRPPGHHAYADQCAGFCFLNNSAIVAEHLSRAGERVAVLDIDVHHGNGTQSIFEHRADVLTISLHGDPERFYPFYWGYAHERGIGAGLGANINIPISRGTDEHGYLPLLDRALSAIRDFGASIIVVALGLDAFEGDPFDELAITTAGFGLLARRIADAGLPLLLIQEGGYLSDALGDNLAEFLVGVG